MEVCPNESLYVLLIARQDKGQADEEQVTFTNLKWKPKAITSSSTTPAKDKASDSFSLGTTLCQITSTVWTVIDCNSSDNIAKSKISICD